ncbi:flagellar hook-basal body protein [Bacillus suaedae]|uniref:Flagellar hook-basal body protein n=1 Tax=Halalkalibacter suaedae TaxID=2822140 RepID=A0A941AQU3_9BACI|nr:flagellar hook-basal body protein [Bacillus suaedae]MBP3953186.1 flagellar hook-basal body protein [Bacillus suaedae]
MNTSMIAASVTMGQLQKKIDTVSHNMANASTTGYKRREATFSDLLFQQVNNQTVPSKEVGRLTPLGLRVGSGARIAQTALRLDQGSMIPTDRELDFALTERDQFFRIESIENGVATERLTRDGAFYLTESEEAPGQWSLVTSSGSYVLGADGNRMNVPDNFKSISLSNGQLVATMGDGTTQALGQLGLTQVLKPQLLEGVGDNLYQLSDFAALGFAEADVIQAVGLNQQALSQGMLEGSNVDIGQEMSELLTAQRHYQFNARSISMADDMSGLINGIRR